MFWFVTDTFCQKNSPFQLNHECVWLFRPRQWFILVIVCCCYVLRRGWTMLCACSLADSILFVNALCELCVVKLIACGFNVFQMIYQMLFNIMVRRHIPSWKPRRQLAGRVCESISMSPLSLRINRIRPSWPLFLLFGYIILCFMLFSID